MDWDRTAQVHGSVVWEVFTDHRSGIQRVGSLMVGAIKAGNKIMLCGNGGSAADAQHFAGEMINKFLMARQPYAAIALTTDTSVLTAIGNDEDYGAVFEKQVQALGTKGDVLVAISTSGRSANVCRAVEAAREAGVLTVALTGGDGGRLGGMADHCLSVSCTDVTPRIQEGHLLIIHLLCEFVEEKLAGKET